MYRGLLLLLMLIFFTSSCKSQNTMKLIYVGDPMCSWCYGFSEELAAVVKNYEKDLELEVVMGGLRPYFDKPISEMKDFLSHHWEDVNKASGMPFVYGILDRADLVYDTEPPCRAVVVIREMSPNHELDFFKACQSAFYYENKDMSQTESYHGILNELQISTEAFDKLFHSDEMKLKVKEDFKRAKEVGVNSFPTLLFQVNGETHILAQGYVKSAKIIEKIESRRD